MHDIIVSEGVRGTAEGVLPATSGIGGMTMKFRLDKKYLYWGATALLVIIGGIGFYYLIFHSNSLKSNLYRLFSIATPIIDGVVLAYLMWPIVNSLEKRLFYPFKDRMIGKHPSLAKKEERLKKYCRGISILLTLVFVLSLVTSFFRFVIPQIASSIQNIVSQYSTYVNNLTTWLDRVLAANPEIEKTVGDLIDTYSQTLEDWMNNTLLPQMNTILKTVSLSMLSFAKALWNLILGLIISIYLLGNKERFLNQGKKMVYAFLDARHANAFISDAKLIDQTFGGFINGKLLDSLIIGVICFICVSIMKLPYPMLVSVIVGVTNIIPFFGPFIGAVPCALLILMVNPMQCLYFIIFILILQQFDGNFLGPKILGGSTGLSGFWVIFSITIFSGLMGVWGMILGVPVFAVFYTLVSRKVNNNLRRKGMPTETDRYGNLKRVDLKTGAFVEEEESDKTAASSGFRGRKAAARQKAAGTDKKEHAD